ncbi:MAG: hypothetical protein U0667_10285 [Chloroflexota bacterium]
MPSSIGDARGILFIGKYLARLPAGPGPSGWEFRIKRVFEGEGQQLQEPSPHRLAAGELIQFRDSGYVIRHLRIGRTYLIANASPTGFHSITAVAWEVLPHGRVRLVRQYDSQYMNPRFARPTTVRQVVALMTPPGELPPTDTAPAEPAPPADAVQAVRAVATWLLRILDIGAG